MSATDAIDVEKLVIFGCMRAHLVSTQNEAEMRARLHKCLMHSGIALTAHVQLPYNAGHIDFLSQLGYAVIVAQRESFDEVFLRARTIAGDERVMQLLVITTRANHRKLPGGMCSKPVDVFWIGGVS
jgi:hypothetical protein